MTSQPSPKDGTTALVTGAARGIGAAIAQRLAVDGHRVALWDIDADALASVAGRIPGSVAVTADVSDEDAVQAAMTSTVDQLGGLDVVVNNAGIEMRAPLREHSVSAWDRVIGVNATGPFLVARTAIPHLRSSGRAAVINIASIAVTGFSGQAAYDASKGAVVSLTRSLAVELGGDGIRVNAVCPGFIDTDMLRDALLGDLGAKVTRGLPLRRLGRPEEVAATVAFLASCDGAYITGQALYVDGGMVRS